MTSELVAVKYIGRHPAVEVDLDGLGETTVFLDETVKATSDIARRLLLQESNWVSAVTEAPRKSVEVTLAEAPAKAAK